MSAPRYDTGSGMGEKRYALEDVSRSSPPVINHTE
ncbi:uncharacterized protein FTOL_13727 [Fusarium torulosum]|uniref:Uncharacterized protein n=1 Tax=Fusarium torulosum TaxID=33205 RepID=A0AAE8SQ47_9HYPO|nr:uncharacterized protein FTOL_13727 [Fusarium torulosum]